MITVSNEVLTLALRTILISDRTLLPNVLMHIISY